MNQRDLVARRIRELMQPHKDNVITGAAKDWGEYQKMVGFIEGATKALAEIENLLEGDFDDDTGR